MHSIVKFNRKFENIDSEINLIRTILLIQVSVDTHSKPNTWNDAIVYAR